MMEVLAVPPGSLVRPELMAGQRQSGLKFVTAGWSRWLFSFIQALVAVSR